MATVLEALHQPDERHLVGEVAGDFRLNIRRIGKDVSHRLDHCAVAIRIEFDETPLVLRKVAAGSIQ